MISRTEILVWIDIGSRVTGNILRSRTPQIISVIQWCSFCFVLLWSFFLEKYIQSLLGRSPQFHTFRAACFLRSRVRFFLFSFFSIKYFALFGRGWSSIGSGAGTFDLFSSNRCVLVITRQPLILIFYYGRYLFWAPSFYFRDQLQISLHLWLQSCLRHHEELHSFFYLPTLHQFRFGQTKIVLSI